MLAHTSLPGPASVMTADRRIQPEHYLSPLEQSLESRVAQRLRDLMPGHPLHKALTALLASRGLLDVAIGNLLRTES